MKYLFYKCLFFMFVLWTINAEASSIVLFDFKSQNIPGAAVKEFSERLRNKLGETSIVLREEEMNHIIKSNSKQLASSKDSIIELRKLLNAGELIWGSVSKDSKGYTFNITVVCFRFDGKMGYDKKKIQFGANDSKLTNCINEIVERILKETPERFFIGRIVRVENFDVYINPGKLKFQEGALLNVSQPVDTMSSVNTIPYKETGKVVVKKIFGDTLVLGTRLGQVQPGGVVAMKSFCFDYAKPMLKYAPKPSYPAGAIKAEIQGVVLTSVIIDTSGKVSGVKVIKSVYPAIDSSAVAVLKQWVFFPAMQDGVPVEDTMEIPIRFSLQGSK